MCFNAEVSFTTYIIGTISSVILALKGFPKEAIFYFFIIQMQLVEYFLWNDQTCNDFNKLITKFGIILNHLQPIILYLLIKYYNDGRTFDLPKWLNILIIVYTIATIYYTKYVMTNECSLISPESSPHIEWLWNNTEYGNLYYGLFLVVLLSLTYHGLSNNILHTSLMLIGYIVSISLYSKKKSVGSVWCFYAAFAPLLLLFVY